jgi:hypothetical protein
MDTNFTITGMGLQLKDQYGNLAGDQSLAILQWEVGYNPIHHTVSEWASSPTLISWTGWYVRDYQGVGQYVWGSNGTTTNSPAPLYLFTQLNENPNQVGLWRITGELNLNGQGQIVDILQASISPVVGSVSTTSLSTADYTTWQPTAIPEPSYSIFAVALFAIAVIAKKLKWYA